MKKRFAVGVPMSVGAVVLAVACSPDGPTVLERESSQVIERGIALDLTPLELSAPEKKDLVAFLGALTDTLPKAIR